MTPYINVGGANPISAITLQAMADLGYTVDVSLADDYELPGTVPPGAGADRAGRVYDLTGDVVRVPVRVIDADGRVVRVIPAPPGWRPPPSRGPAVLIDRRRDRNR